MWRGRLPLCSWLRVSQASAWGRMVVVARWKKMIWHDGADLVYRVMTFWLITPNRFATSFISRKLRSLWESGVSFEARHKSFVRCLWFCSSYWFKALPSEPRRNLPQRPGLEWKLAVPQPQGGRSPQIAPDAMAWTARAGSAHRILWRACKCVSSRMRSWCRSCSGVCQTHPCRRSHFWTRRRGDRSFRIFEPYRARTRVQSWPVTRSVGKRFFPARGHVTVATRFRDRADFSRRIWPTTRAGGLRIQCARRLSGRIVFWTLVSAPSLLHFRMEERWKGLHEMTTTSRSKWLRRMVRSIFSPSRRWRNWPTRMNLRCRRTTVQNCLLLS